LYIDFGINNERQDCKIGALCGGVLVGRVRMTSGDEHEGIQSMASYI
jgi:hypothetical protein